MADMDSFYAHIRDDGARQTVEEHLQGTAALCSSFAARFGEARRGALLGQAHDIGKASHAFQKRLAGGPKIDHATAGALACAKQQEWFSACCVAGHHGGLPDMGNARTDPAGAPTLIGRLKDAASDRRAQSLWNRPLPPAGSAPAFSDPFAQALWTRMLYSCLVDADYLDTERFMTGTPPERGGYDPLPVLLERLEQYIRPWFPAKNELNRQRCTILERCLEAAALPQGIYSLTVPTGGGKTVASLAFALRHAVTHGMDRVIYVIPYTSIIEQNADVFRSIVGEANVIEHHSNIRFDSDEELSADSLHRQLATENWDAPIIVTTAVQFFESLYANRPSQCRKLHSIANSVVIFDEAQMLPSGHLAPCAGVIAELVDRFRATAVLCTATQPALEDLLQSFCPKLQLREICPDTETLYQKFQRVTYRNGGRLASEALLQELCAQKQVLCIVNTRKAARQIFDALPEEGHFHLSTLMHPMHRRAVLGEIRSRLSAGLVCRVVSTSLIEAGVDVDFPAVYRELAGLDSIAQAAGRCNREGRRSAEDSIVTYFESDAPTPLLQQINVAAAREALCGGRDPGDPATIRAYFTAWRSLVGDRMDKSRAVEHLRKGIRGCTFPFATVAKEFHFIDQATCTVYILTERNGTLLQKLLTGTACRADHRDADRYAVNIYEQHYRALLAAGDIQPLGEGRAVLLNTALYDERSGLSLEADTGKAEFV